MAIKGRLWVKILYRSVFGRKFSSPFLGPIIDFVGIFQGLYINFEFWFPKKVWPMREDLYNAN